MQATLFIVWRESFEALLVIGILYAWLKRENLYMLTPQLWLGCSIGFFVALLLAGGFWFAGSWFAGAGGEWFFTAMMLIASCLILQMIVWLHYNGKQLKQELERKAAQQVAQSKRWGIILLSAIAVAREGSETVIFLSGVVASQHGSSLSLLIGGLLGFALALISFFLLQKCSTFLPWHWFFKITEFVLLLIGGGLFVTACDKAAAQLEAYDLPEAVFTFFDTPLWNTTWLLKDNSTLTGLTGYHALPSALQISSLVLYWLAAFGLFYAHNWWHRGNRNFPLKASA